MARLAGEAKSDDAGASATPAWAAFEAPACFERVSWRRSGERRHTHACGPT